MKLELEPIGVVHSPYRNRYEAPPQGGEEVSEIVVFDEYEGGVKDIEGFRTCTYSTIYIDLEAIRCP